MTALYHFTDTVRLPWIVYSGELRPGRNRVGGYPEPEFIWASTDPRDDGSASMHRGEGYRSGLVRHIRLTLPQDQFIPWAEVPSRYPSWTADQVERLQQSAARMRTDPANWWCRTEPLPLTQIPATDWHWRSYRSNQWTPLPGPNALFKDNWPTLAVRIGDHCFASNKLEGSRGEQAYLWVEAGMVIAR